MSIGSREDYVPIGNLIDIQSSSLRKTLFSLAIQDLKFEKVDSLILQFTDLQKCGTYPFGQRSRHWLHGAPWNATLVPLVEMPCVDNILEWNSSSFRTFSSRYSHMLRALNNETGFHWDMCYSKRNSKKVVWLAAIFAIPERVKANDKCKEQPLTTRDYGRLQVRPIKQRQPF